MWVCLKIVHLKWPFYTTWYTQFLSHTCLDKQSCRLETRFDWQAHKPLVFHWCSDWPPSFSQMFWPKSWQIYRWFSASSFNPINKLNKLNKHHWPLATTYMSCANINAEPSRSLQWTIVPIQEILPIEMHFAAKMQDKTALREWWVWENDTSHRSTKKLWKASYQTAPWISQLTN